jgi:plastocyanin
VTRRHALLTALALTGCTAGSAGCAGRAPRAYTVTIEEMRFTPASLSVRPGDTVEWVNADLVPHTATARDGVFDSKTIAAGSSWRWTVRAQGTVRYTCTLHPTMSALLQVG